MKYKALDTVLLHEGVLKLTEHQLPGRLHLVSNIGKGAYQILNTVCFKKGEVFEIDGNLPKTENAEKVEEKKKRRRRTKAQIEAENAKDSSE